MPMRRPSLGTIVGSLALIVAMSGTAVAVTTAQSGDKLIRHRSLSGNRLRHNTVTGYEINESSLGTVPRAAKANALPALAWHPFTFVNGWRNVFPDTARPAGWAIDAQGIVHFRGLVGASSQNCSPTFATIPTSILPPDLEVNVPIFAIEAGVARLNVSTTGAVAIYGGTTAACGDNNLEGVTFTTK